MGSFLTSGCPGALEDPYQCNSFKPTLEQNVAGAPIAKEKKYSMTPVEYSKEDLIQGAWAL